MMQSATHDSRWVEVANELRSYKANLRAQRGEEFEGGWRFAASNYEQHVNITTAGRLLAALDNGLIGLVPDQTYAGDIVCVLSGAETPFVLRPVNDDGEAIGKNRPHKSGKYRFIGECYIHGAMHGEYIGSEEDKKWFELF